MRVLFRAITPKRAKLIDPQRVDQELRNVLNNEVKPEIRADFFRTVSTWKTRVNFTATTRISLSQISMTVSPTGAGAKIWNYVNEGTRPHLIRPKRARGVLAFRRGYMAKSKRGAIVSGSGGAFGPTAFSKVVHHPGTEGRDFTTTIANKHRPRFKRLCENGLRRALR